ncbi:hypothetical protein [Vibrio alginolyticus]|uniref:hypothetical protein n=1 Tax=Vibrio alginolyticus TaxID=663 RepID=UPI000723051B|nr:hypothetical protein [Vibrio alginolyticus]ALR95830.1 hypothetical protein AT730_24795 [Vibrio alginolyticus]MBY7710609.1 hypothetical protein [Vibrio alginolyticus]
MTTSRNINSIGWLYAEDKRINLTPIFDGEIFPVFVNVSKEAFKATNGDKELMKELALKTLYGTGEKDN